eukprot:COSAG01_NODE_531_length_15849_cov_29.199556_8_plen_89_part_00
MKEGRQHGGAPEGTFPHSPRPLTQACPRAVSSCEEGNLHENPALATVNVGWSAPQPEPQTTAGTVGGSEPSAATRAASATARPARNIF